jgi:ABC-2 type transport system permease protein
MLGLLISGVTRNQFAASQMAMLASFMPATMLSGFVYDIHNMPTAIRVISLMLLATHFMDLIRDCSLPERSGRWCSSRGLLLLYLVG